MMNRCWTTLFIAAVIFVPVSTVRAEPVLIESAAGQKGEGWLFGSPVDGRCWIATPKHVVEAGGRLVPFLWRDVRGHEGTGRELLPASEPLDLAFSPVDGRESGACLSRLGVDDLTRFVMRQPLVWAQAMFKTHLRAIEMRLSDANARFVRFEPTNQDELKHLRKGLSGTPLILRDPAGGADRPIALVVNVDGAKGVGHALRFDLIKAEFARAVAIGAKALPAANIANADFKLVNATGRSRSPATAPAAALTAKGCWIARPADGGRSYSAVIQPTSTDGIVVGLSVLFDAGCGAAPDGLVVQAPEGDGLWSTVASCDISETAASCLIGRRQMTPLRLIIIKRDGGDVAIAKIDVKTAGSK